MPAATVAALGEGTHHVLVHSKDSLGLWGPPLDIPLSVDLTGPAVDAASVGPNPSNGVLTDKSNPGYLVVSAQITDKDAGGRRRATWSTPRPSWIRRRDPPGGTRPAADRGRRQARFAERNGLRADPDLPGPRARGGNPPRLRPRPGRGRQLGTDVRGEPHRRQDRARARHGHRPPNPTNGAATLTLDRPRHRGRWPGPPNSGSAPPIRASARRTRVSVSATNGTRNGDRTARRYRHRRAAVQPPGSGHRGQLEQRGEHVRHGVQTQPDLRRTPSSRPIPRGTHRPGRSRRLWAQRCRPPRNRAAPAVCRSPWPVSGTTKRVT